MCYFCLVLLVAIFLIYRHRKMTAGNAVGSASTVAIPTTNAAAANSAVIASLPVAAPVVSESMYAANWNGAMGSDSVHRVMALTAMPAMPTVPATATH